MAINFDEQKLVQQLASIFSRPEYRETLAARLATLTVKDHRPTPVHALRLAEETIRYAFGTEGAPKLLHPVTVEELVPATYPIRLYRVFDGIDRAGTLGGWWADRKLIKHCVTTSPSGIDHAKTIKAMLNRMFVHPHWNRGIDIARLSVPVGARTPAIIGLGNWRAMRAARDPALPKTASDPLHVQSEQDVYDKLKMDTTLEARQYFLPFFKDLWVTKIPHLSPNWPLD